MLVGFGVLRPCALDPEANAGVTSMHRVGPLATESTDVAHALVLALAEHVPQDVVPSFYVDVPSLRPDGVAMLQSLGLECVMDNAHMYRVPPGAAAPDLHPRAFTPLSQEVG